MTTSSADASGQASPSVAPGADVTWFYTVTNTGTVPLTDLRVRDDRGLAVTCPAAAAAFAGSTGNPIPVLAPGESTTCTATAPVAPLPTP